MSTQQLRIPGQAVAPYSPSDKIMITGNFDNWEHRRFVLTYDDEDDSFSVTLPLGKETIIFKFVINDTEWITLPYFETKTDDHGFLNNVWNPELDAIDVISPGDNENLDEITIGSRGGNPGATEAKASAGLAICERVDSQHAEHDYIQVSSQDELSSTEDVGLDHATSPYDLSSREGGNEIFDSRDGMSPRLAVRPSMLPSRSSSSLRLQSLVSVVKKVKTYWSG
ncbi:LAMI_0C04940g1_1 [Lachancea mirantina]|uniref:LAMI_0C04940g1_1 n=1 Tax=Lachancea mirantina TaxID=1230905 RepID=A0A1G4J356_9SACH|nr:LAMI_0C04940g1_1 [Lachancea mirantina]